MHAEIGAVRRKSLHGEDLDATALDSRDAELIPARDRLADPAAFAVRDDHPHAPEPRELAGERKQRGRVDSIVVRDQYV